jgi:hypothetical protein
VRAFFENVLELQRRLDGIKRDVGLLNDRE